MIALFSTAYAIDSRLVLENHIDGHEAHLARMHDKGWELGEAAPRDAQLELIVAVKQNSAGVAALERALLAVSMPSSPTYGKHLSNAQAQALVAPSAASLDAVHAWLSEHGIALANLTSTADFVGGLVSVAAAEALLGTSFHAFSHAPSGSSVVRAARPYTVPAPLAAHVDFVAPTVSFPPIRPLARPTAAPDKKVVTPALLRDLYGLADSDVGKGAASNNTQAVASFLKQ
jgi:tripeptidyl-peptidase-1